MEAIYFCSHSSYKFPCWGRRSLKSHIDRQLPYQRQRLSPISASRKLFRCSTRYVSKFRTKNSVCKAFSSMVYIVTGLQAYTLSMQQLPDSNSVIESVRSDTHSSFLWLFQEIFSRTPELMIYIMLTIANFITYSISDPDMNQADSISTEVKQDVSNEPTVDVYIRHLQMPVAPVSVQVEADDYECYDRTELMYQNALSKDRDNPLLLANYAEFLLLVRRDYDRAHNAFMLALKADPEDAEIISKYAKFLWLIKGDKTGAEEAYKAAMVAEPSNPFYSGCYAHFLWHSVDPKKG